MIFQVKPGQFKITQTQEGFMEISGARFSSGLRDKTGRMIFEHDIVETSQFPGREWIVIFTLGSFTARDEEGNEQYFGLCKTMKSENSEIWLANWRILD